MSRATYQRTVFAVFIFIHTAAFGQLDPLNNQYLSNQSMINPAYVGVHNMAMIMASTRIQWLGIEGAPKTHTLIANSSITDHAGAGMTMVSDNYGINNNIEMMLAGSYKIDWINHSLSLGLQGGYLQNSLNYSKLNLETNDPSIPASNTRFGVSNFGTGAFLKHDKYYVGFSVPRILRVNLAEAGTQEVLYRRHYYLSAGYVFDYIQSIKIKPSILVRAIEGETVAVDLNGQIIINDEVWLGLLLRNLNAIGLNFQYIEANMRFGYAFELPISSLASASYGTHALMLSLDLDLFKNHKLRARYF